MPNKPYVVVAGTDYSEQAVRALHAAYRQAAQHAPAELHVAHVCLAASPDGQAPVAPAAGLSLPLKSVEELRRELIHHLDQQLQALPEFSPANVRVYGHVLIDNPSLGLTSLASQLEADLLVVGSHGLHGVVRWLLGSVADAVIRQAGCPVLVVPPKAHALPPPVIEPPCPRCVAARQGSSGAELWCEQHREHHGRRHTYHQGDRRAADTNFPLVAR
ncbi:MAG: universal stress protein [Myxococcales bacterium]